MQKKSCPHFLPFEHNAQTYVTDRQTDKQTDHGTVTSIAIGEIACQRCRLITKQVRFTIVPIFLILFLLYAMLNITVM